MTNEDDTRPDPLGPAGQDGPPHDGPQIDPRDPLGLGDLPLDAPEGDEPSRDDASPTHADDQDALEPASSPPGAHGVTTSAHEPDLDEASADEASADEMPADEQGDREQVDDPQSPDEPAPSPVAAPDVPAPDGDAVHAPRVAPAAGSPPVRPPRSGWARLGHAMRPRTTQGQLITAGLCALLGFALVVQVRQATDTQLGALRQNDLVRLLDETSTRTDELERESLDLQRERDELLSGSDRQQAALDAARRTAAMQGILTGRLPATGPGVRITLTEPDAEIRPATMLHVLEELRNAGAEAMELNGQRIIASSAFTGTRGAVELDGATLESPYRWTVIGDPDTIAPALEIPGGAMAQVRKDGGRGTVEKSDRVEVTAVRVLPEPVHASPVADGS
ncbi:DUF881 domain-containing protein [Cellulomonas dongxiuzhuiae]|uniref:DUF881 domain-containing protein n=1 Tax=Cellulomonas dongxiuzhuiae TaxID=2819979 RepID=UPI001AAFBC15|nr:DUF881 domain-containing protein [Cellulomonas dongxiuzhuiae]MBO3090185.1 DUF881 domain-containing protein [Cellulomonas dongxiuzhuiae]